MEKDYSFLPFLITENLYFLDKNMLASSAIVPEQTTKTIQAPVVLSSNSTDKVLFLVLENEFFSPQERELLVKLVEATKIEFGQVQRILLANYKNFQLPYLHYIVVFARQKPSFLLGEKYAIFEKDTKKIVWSASLGELVEDKQQKIALWTIMKKMFGL